MTPQGYRECLRGELRRMLSPAVGACAAFSVMLVSIDVVGGSVANGGVTVTPLGGTIAYVLTSERWAVYQTDGGKSECPKGLNDWGPIEQFNALYPSTGGKRTLVDTELRRDAAAWFPDTETDHPPFKEAQGAVAIGLNLDGKVGAQDFTSPDGEKGVDNQLFRLIGCLEDYRGPTGKFFQLMDRFVRDFDYNRVMIELTNVHDLKNDENVDVTIYRGRDRLMIDATGNDVVPGGSQRIDQRWGKKYIQHLHGRIVDGVLTTDPADISLPHAIFAAMPGEDLILGARFRLSVTPEKAEGLLAGYSDIDKWYRQFMHSWYGHIYYPALYQELTKLADGYPDPKTGQNTAISSALQIKFAQVFIQHSEE